MAALLPPVSASRYGDNGLASSLGSISVSIASRSNLGAKLHFMSVSSRLGSIQYYGPWTSFCKLCSHKERNVVDSILSSWYLKATKGPSDFILSETVGDIADGCASKLQVDKSDSGDQANTLVLDSFVQNITNDSPVRKETLPSVQNVPSPSDSTPSLCITVVGATGDLARKKIFPALFALFYNGCLPKNIGIFGYSRSSLSDEDLRNLISENLTCRVDHHENCMDKMEGFLDRVFYVQGTYDTCEGMLNLDKRMRQLEGGRIANRIFYLSVPNDVVVEVATCVAKNAQSKKGYTRVIIEKPFGVDDDSSARMTNGLLSELREEQIFRIDHLLGKELIENLTVLRFSNLIFEPLWNRNYIRNVQIVYAEDWGMQGRGRYFDEQGVIRDIVQSHLLQTIALLAMEPPVSLGDEDIRNEKVKVLRSMRKLALQDVVLGQYKESVSKDGKSIIPGYIDEEDVPPGSLTPTFVAAVFFIDNGRWDGVPFLIKAGHGLIKHKVEIRIQFRHVPGNLYKERERYGFNINQATNELVLRIHPDEAILLKIMNKVPGLELQLDFSELNLLYKDKYNSDVPDSYERLILDVIDGDNHLFIRSDELTATWDILTPLLKDIETLKVPPELYMFGGRGPVGAYYLGAKHGVRWADD